MEEFCYMSCPHWSRLAQSHVEISLSAVLKSVENQITAFHGIHVNNTDQAK